MDELAGLAAVLLDQIQGFLQFVLPRPEPVWTQTLIDVLAELGVEQKSARQALARTAAEGLLASDRSGRRVRWSLSTSGRSANLLSAAMTARGSRRTRQSRTRSRG